MTVIPIEKPRPRIGLSEATAEASLVVSRHRMDCPPLIGALRIPALACFGGSGRLHTAIDLTMRDARTAERLNSHSVNPGSTASSIIETTNRLQFCTNRMWRCGKIDRKGMAVYIENGSPCLSCFLDQRSCDATRCRRVFRSRNRPHPTLLASSASPQATAPQTTPCN